jgi:hypothetical protein
VVSACCRSVHTSGTACSGGTRALRGHGCTTPPCCAVASSACHWYMPGARV